MPNLRLQGTIVIPSAGFQALYDGVVKVSHDDLGHNIHHDIIMIALSV
jgi:hypothetical protein